MMSLLTFKRARRYAGALLSTALLLAPCAKGADLLWTNASTSILTVAPMIDALSFANYGVFDIFVTEKLGFRTYSTVNFTNIGSFFLGSGTMRSTPGWQFRRHDPFNAGNDRPAANFFNDSNARIEARDPLVADLFTARAVIGPSYLVVEATNIINRGHLAVGANGEISLKGDRINVSRSGLEIRPIQPIGSINDFDQGLFFPDVAIHDLFWAVGNYTEDDPLFTGNLWDGSVAEAPGTIDGENAFAISPTYANSYVNGQVVPLTLTNFTGTITNVTGIVTNQTIALSNIVKGALFVSAPPAFTVQSWMTAGEDGYRTFHVLMSVAMSNAVTTLPDLLHVYIQDSLGGDPDSRGVLLENIFNHGADVTSRPGNYIVDRGAFRFPGLNVDRPPEPDFFLSSGQPTAFLEFDTVTNSIVEDGVFASYAAFIDNVVSRPPVIPAGTVTNLPGRVRILGGDVDLTHARIRTEGQTIVRASNLISTSNAIIDSENISFYLTTTNGTLLLDDVVPDAVARLRGAISLWSAQWENAVQIRITNNFGFTNEIVGTNILGDPITNTMAFELPLTNSLTVGFHALMINASALQAVLPVTMHELSLAANNLVLNDNITIGTFLLLNSSSVTINGNFIIPAFLPPNNPAQPFGLLNGMNHFKGINAPNVLFFTNNGVFFVAGQAHFGSDRPTPYSAVVNNGISVFGSLFVRSDYIENGPAGFLSAGAQMVLQGNQIVLDGTGFANVSSTGIMQFFANTLELRGTHIDAGNALQLHVTNSLFDAGPGSANVISTRNGFHLLTKPPTGDLLGTTFDSIIASTNFPSTAVFHSWAGEDRGVSASGFINNAAIGILRLSPSIANPLFVFSPATGNNGLYVQVLDLSSLSDYATQLQINPGLVIYYSTAFLGFTPPGSLSPEEFLDGQFGGRLRWVPAFIAPTSPVNGTFVSIQYPQPGQAIRTGSAVIQGTAGASAGPAWVYYRLNNGAWTPAPNYETLTEWSGELHQLKPGQNTVQAIALNSQGAISEVTSVQFLFEATATMTVQINGEGSVVTNYNGQELVIGNSYTMTATPEPGYSFSGWSGSISTNSETINFTMQSNMVLVANFVEQPYAHKAGIYNGLFYESTGPEFRKSGAFRTVVTSNGRYTGSINLGGIRYSFAGRLNDAGGATNVLTARRAPTLNLVMQVEAGNTRIVGSVGDGATWTADLLADRATFNGTTRKTPFAGRYTLLFPGNDDEPESEEPFGNGFGVATVSRSGNINFQGSLADGTRVSQTTTISGDGVWPLYQVLYSGRGQVLGWLTFSNAANQDVSGIVNWIRLPIPSARFYPEGFNLDILATGSLYTNITAVPPGLTNATLILSGGNLTASITNQLSYNGFSLVSSGNNQLKLNLNPGIGVFNGSVVENGTTIKFKGAILQKPVLGSGYFLGTDQSGRVTITP